MAPKPVTVSQLNAYIKRILSTDPLLSQVAVSGEISNLKYHDSGHVYFSLKDENGKINCFLPESYKEEIPLVLEDGMAVVVYGRVSVFERGGYYSLHVRMVEDAGSGRQKDAFEALKQKLLEEGLFDKARKKPLPTFPGRIAIITSQTGAALQDMLKILSSRNPLVEVLVIPVLVQGPGAPEEIANGIAAANREALEVDLLIVGRGGGSLEELAAFNHETVARSIAASEIPVISAVGHETDVTISDFVADVRGETPTAAATLAVPDITDLLQYIVQLQTDLMDGMDQVMKHKSDLVERLDLGQLKQTLLYRMDLESYKIEQFRTSILERTTYLLDKKMNSVNQYGLILSHLAPELAKRRSLAEVFDQFGNRVTGINQLTDDQRITLHFSDGQADAVVQEIRRKNP